MFWSGELTGQQGVQCSEETRLRSQVWVFGNRKTWFLSPPGFEGRFWCTEYTSSLLLLPWTTSLTVVRACHWHNAADVPSPCSRYDWGASRLSWQPLHRGKRGSDGGEEEALWVEDSKSVQHRWELWIAKVNAGFQNKIMFKYWDWL